MTSHDPGTGFAPDPTIDLKGSPNLIGPKLPIPHLGIEPDTKKPAWYIGAVFLGQFGLFVALLAPVMVSMQLKVSSLTDDPVERVSMLGMVLTGGAVAAFLFNPIGGRLSDRTIGRWGRRRPWMIIGITGLMLALLVIALGTNTVTLAIGWFIAQAFANMGFAAFTASLADQLSEEQYGKTSGLVGIAQNVGIMVATWMGTFFTENMLLLFMVPAVIGFIAMTIYALSIPEPVLVKNKYPFNVKEFIQTFWTNPIRFPDFGLAWWGRFMIILASYLFTSFRLIYMENHLGLDTKSAAAAVALGVTIYTVSTMVSSLFAGWLSDKLGRRKVIVAAAILVFGIGTYLLLHVDSVSMFYVVEAIMGLSYGAYLAVDLALVFEVLPDRMNTGKDLGVFNMANALPQSLAPAFGGFLLANLGGGTDFTALLVVALAAAVIGAVLTMLIRSVK